MFFLLLCVLYVRGILHERSIKNSDRAKQFHEQCMNLNKATQLSEAILSLDGYCAYHPNVNVVATHKCSKKDVDIYEKFLQACPDRSLDCFEAFNRSQKTLENLVYHRESYVVWHEQSGPRWACKIHYKDSHVETEALWQPETL